jgi:hypothetical protein
MANPDVTKTVPAISASAPEVNGALSGTICGLLMIGFTIMFFELYRDMTYKAGLWICFLAFIISLFSNAISQSLACTSGSFGKVLGSSLISSVACLFAIGISSIPTCRIPIASVFAPAFISPDLTIATSGSEITQVEKTIRETESTCCSQTVTLESVEAKKNGYILKSISYSFYIFFAMLFAVTAETSIVSAC